MASHPVVEGCRMCQDTESPVWRLTGLLSPDDHKINGALGRVETDWMIWANVWPKRHVDQSRVFFQWQSDVRSRLLFVFATIVAFWNAQGVVWKDDIDQKSSKRDLRQTWRFHDDGWWVLFCREINETYVERWQVILWSRDAECVRILNLLCGD